MLLDNEFYPTDNENDNQLDCYKGAFRSGHAAPAWSDLRSVHHMTNAGFGMFLQVSEVSKERSSIVTTYEERIWLLQLQQPEEISRSIYAWKLSDDINDCFKHTTKKWPTAKCRVEHVVSYPMGSLHCSVNP